MPRCWSFFFSSGLLLAELCSLKVSTSVLSESVSRCSGKGRRTICPAVARRRLRAIQTFLPAGGERSMPARSIQRGRERIAPRRSWEAAALPAAHHIPPASARTSAALLRHAPARRGGRPALGRSASRSSAASLSTRRSTRRDCGALSTAASQRSSEPRA